MPPAPGDREARRKDVSEAVWHVLADKGFSGLTLRAVAAAMSVSTGMLMHDFPTKRALIAHALDLLEKRTAERPRRERPTEGLATVRAMLLDILPLTAGDTARNRIWVSSWDLALADDGLATDQADRYTRLRSAIRPHSKPPAAWASSPQPPTRSNSPPPLSRSPTDSSSKPSSTPADSPRTYRSPCSTTSSLRSRCPSLTPVPAGRSLTNRAR